MTRVHLNKIALIGAGPAGISMGRELLQRGIPFQGFERSHRFGGLWDLENSWSPAYHSLITNSSRATTHLKTPCPPGWPDYPSRELAFQYLSAVANQWGLDRFFEFNSQVIQIEKTQNNLWLVTTENTKTKTMSQALFQAVIIAAGNQSTDSAYFPTELLAAARNSGIETIHSSQYRSPIPFQNRKVLVVGLGNSGSEIATEVSRFAEQTFVSLRTPPWIAPLYTLGTPSDVFVSQKKSLPPYLELPFYRLLQYWYVGRHLPKNFPAPPHDILDRLPITDRGIVDAIKKNQVRIVGEIEGFKEKKICFKSPSNFSSAIDSVIFATGYRRTYPFLPSALSPTGSNLFVPYLLLFHPMDPTLFFLPEVVVPQGAWPIFSEQAKAIASHLEAGSKSAKNYLLFEKKRTEPNPDFKGHLFRQSDAYHVHPKKYVRALKSFSDWILNG